MVKQKNNPSKQSSPANKNKKDKKNKKGKGENKKPPLHPGGRPTKLTAETVEKFTTAVSIGSSYALAARHAGVSEEVVYLWLRIGREERSNIEDGGKSDPTKEGYLMFLQMVEEAEAEAGIGYQVILDKAARIYPNWAYKMQQARGFISPETQTNLNLTIPADMPTEWLDRIIANPAQASAILREYEATKRYISTGHGDNSASNEAEKDASGTAGK